MTNSKNIITNKILKATIPFVQSASEDNTNLQVIVIDNQIKLEIQGLKYGANININKAFINFTDSQFNQLVAQALHQLLKANNCI